MVVLFRLQRVGKVWLKTRQPRLQKYEPLFKIHNRFCLLPIRKNCTIFSIC